MHCVDQIQAFLMLKTNGIYSYHWAVKGLITVTLLLLAIVPVNVCISDLA